MAEDRIVLRYVDNPNGSVDDIAGICNEGRNVVGLMPHPERAISDLLGSVDGVALLQSLLKAPLTGRSEPARADDSVAAGDAGGAEGGGRDAGFPPGGVGDALAVRVAGGRFDEVGFELADVLLVVVGRQLRLEIQPLLDEIDPLDAARRCPARPRSSPAGRRSIPGVRRRPRFGLWASSASR